MDKVTSALNALVKETQVDTVDKLVSFLESKTEVDSGLKEILVEYKNTLVVDSSKNTLVVGSSKNTIKVKNKDTLRKLGKQITASDPQPQTLPPLQGAFGGGRGGFGGRGGSRPPSGRGGFGGGRGRGRR